MGKEKRTGQPIEDRALKAAAQFMGQELLPLLGIEGTMKRIAPTEQVYLKLTDLMEDFNYEMEDGSWKHLEFESDELTKEDLMRFRAYEAVTSYTYGVEVTTYVVCSSRARLPRTELSSGINTWRVQTVMLKDQSSDEVIDRLEQAQRERTLERKELLSLLLTPLMAGELSQLERILRSMDLLRRAEDVLGKEDILQMQAVLYTLAMKLLTKEELFQVKEGMRMTLLGEMIWQDGVEEGLQKGIQAVIGLCRKLNMEEDGIVPTLMEQLGLTEEKAREYYQKYTA